VRRACRDGFPTLGQRKALNTCIAQSLEHLYHAINASDLASVNSRATFRSHRSSHGKREDETLRPTTARRRQSRTRDHIADREARKGEELAVGQHVSKIKNKRE
jgi:hypothetical protein